METTALQTKTVPGFEKYSINESGEIFNDKGQRIMPDIHNRNRIRLRDNDGRKKWFNPSEELVRSLFTDKTEEMKKQPKKADEVKMKPQPINKSRELLSEHFGKSEKSTAKTAVKKTAVTQSRKKAAAPAAPEKTNAELLKESLRSKKAEETAAASRKAPKSAAAAKKGKDVKTSPEPKKTAKTDTVVKEAKQKKVKAPVVPVVAEETPKKKRGPKPKNLAPKGPKNKVPRDEFLQMSFADKRSLHFPKKMTDNDVLQARKDFKAGALTVKEMSLKFGVAEQTAGKALRGVTYQHLPHAVKTARTKKKK